MIGELSENQLHNSLKQYYFQKGDLIEHKLEGYFIDIYREDTLIEIQTSSFSKVKRKYDNLLKNYKPRRLRFFLDKRENTRTSPQLEGIEETNNFSFYYIFQNYGIGYSEYKFKGFWLDNNFGEDFKIPHESGEVKSINLYYTFGNKLSLTLGYPLYAEGNAVVGDESGQHSYKTLFKPKLRKPISL